MSMKNLENQPIGAGKTILLSILPIFLVLLLFFVIEMILRQTKYYNQGSITTSVSSHDKIVLNPGFYEKFYPSFRPSVSIAPFTSSKDTSVIRILALGGSSMAGYPYSFQYSAPAILEVNLKKAFPEKSFEVVNTGVTAFNSFGMAEIMKSIADINPTYIIIYSGHNEFYGALGSASTSGVSSNTTIRKLYLNLYRFAIYQILIRTYHSIWNSTGEQSTSPLMSQMISNSDIRYQDQLYNDTMNDFSANLNLIISLAAKENIPVVISTIVSNLKDQRPMGNDPLAESYFSQADSAFYAGMNELARERYQLALDHDPVRFRAPSAANAIIRTLEKNSSVHLIDIEKTYRLQCEDLIENDSCFTDHLHPDYDGYVYIAQNFFNKLGQLIDPNRLLHQNKDFQFVKPLLDPIEQKLATVNIQILKASPPFVPQFETKPSFTLQLIEKLSSSTDQIDNAVKSILTNESHPSVVYHTLMQSESMHSMNLSMFYSWSAWSPFQKNILSTGIQTGFQNNKIGDELQTLLLVGANEFNEIMYYNGLGAFYLLQKDYVNAKQFLDIVEFFEPDNIIMLNNKVILFTETGDLDSAREYSSRVQFVGSQ